MDGTAEEWFTPSPGQVAGPTFVTRTYDMPNVQAPTQLFYHEHALGDTRLGVYAGLAGAGYMIRDPSTALDGPSTPLPTGAFEIPLVLTDRAFFTDGELSFPRTSTNAKNAYWQAGDGANTILVNGKVWPNLNVERRQYRFRMLAAGNGRTWNPQLDLNGTAVPFTIIGSDGGYLPAPQVITTFTFAITERADILVDFSPFPAGTQITMLNVGGTPAGTLDRIMRFTVQNTTPVTPPTLNPALFPPKPALPTNAPIRIKTFHNLVDANLNAERSVDGLPFSAPDTEFPLVGSTEQWDIVNIGGGGHQVHLHLIEFQVVSRQTINTAAYVAEWQRLNGFRPVTRPIVVDPTPFLTGTPVAAPPIDSGWKDTVRAPSNQLTRILARWAPQETVSGGVQPGQNQFPIDPTAAQGSYLMHCHVLGHEDNDMMRRLPIAPLWAGGRELPGRESRHAPQHQLSDPRGAHLRRLPRRRPPGSTSMNGSTTTTEPGSRRSSTRSATGCCSMASCSGRSRCSRRWLVKRLRRIPPCGTRCPTPLAGSWPSSARTTPAIRRARAAWRPDRRAWKQPA